MLNKKVFNNLFAIYIYNYIDILSQILNCDKKEFKYMSHPCGSYNDSTLNILKKLGVELGFKNVMDIEIEKNMKMIK